jgi:hypothetical protein
LSASKKRVFKNESVRIVAHLEAFENATNREVSLFAKPQGGARRLVQTGAIDATGDFAVTVTLKRSTSFIAEWEGDDRYLPDDSNRVRVDYGVKSGLWLGDTSQRFSWIEVRVEENVKVTRFNVVFYVDYDNCPGRARIDWTLKFRPAVQIRKGNLEIRWDAAGVSRGVVKGTFESRRRVRGTLKASFIAPDTGCRGSTGDGVRWHATTF